MFAGLHQDNFLIPLSETDRERVSTTYHGIRHGAEIPVHPSGSFRKAPGSFVLVCGFVTCKLIFPNTGGYSIIFGGEE